MTSTSWPTMTELPACPLFGENDRRQTSCKNYSHVRSEERGRRRALPNCSRCQVRIRQTSSHGFETTSSKCTAKFSRIVHSYGRSGMAAETDSRRCSTTTAWIDELLSGLTTPTWVTGLNDRLPVLVKMLPAPQIVWQQHRISNTSSN